MSVEPGTPQRGHEDRRGLRAELVERAVAVLANAEVDLRGRAEPDRATMSTSSPISTPHPSTKGTASSTSRRPAYSPPSGWMNPASSGKRTESVGRATQLGDATAAGGLTVERPAVVPLRRTRCRGRSRADRAARSRSAARSCGCRRRASRRGRRSLRAATSTSRCPCPGPGPVLGEHVVDAQHAGAFPCRGLGGGVGGAVVDDHDLVDERNRLHERAADGGDDVADGGLLVAGREADRDPQALLGLAAASAREVVGRSNVRGRGASARDGRTGGVATAQSVGGLARDPRAGFRFGTPARRPSNMAGFTRSSRAAEGRARRRRGNQRTREQSGSQVPMPER